MSSQRSNRYLLAIGLLLALLFAILAGCRRPYMRTVTVPRDSVVATFATLCDTLHDTARYYYTTSTHRVEVQRNGPQVRVRVVRDSIQVPVLTERPVEVEKPAPWWYWLIVGGAILVALVAVVRR